MGKWFLPTAGKAYSQELLEIQGAIVEKLLAELQELKVTMLISPFVREHSFVASSLLFVTEASPIEAKTTHAGVFLVDFSRLSQVPEGITLNHRSPWQLGNHEDGLFIGLDNMIRCFEEVQGMVSFCMLLISPPPRFRPFTP